MQTIVTEIERIDPATKPPSACIIVCHPRRWAFEFLFLSWLVASALGASGQDSRMSDRSKQALRDAVEVKLSSDKHLYKRGEAVWLTAQVKNIGETPVFVFPRTSFDDDGDGAFVIRVKETPHCKLTGTNMAGTPGPPAKDLQFADYIRTSCKLLKPGEFLQARDVLHKITPPFCPGKYTLTVAYLTELFWWTREKIQASESELEFPAVYGAYRGNAITFEVAGEDGKP